MSKRVSLREIGTTSWYGFSSQMEPFHDHNDLMVHYAAKRKLSTLVEQSLFAAMMPFGRLTWTHV